MDRNRQFEERLTEWICILLWLACFRILTQHGPAIPRNAQNHATVSRALQPHLVCVCCLRIPREMPRAQEGAPLPLHCATLKRHGCRLRVEVYAEIDHGEKTLLTPIVTEGRAWPLGTIAHVRAPTLDQANNDKARELICRWKSEFQANPRRQSRAPPSSRQLGTTPAPSQQARNTCATAMA
eukprot:CAMPEP_0115373416 /NCGR_PEP_ID=MMETSP0271-20121206/1422_1 /TAXON_ID=71861 /ORGANISM="Scrippsiella trochoidea, Strain CCMP3099" /LENGTH=181 /DNA_ID=CAMNT_0002796421 /DNA_START=194 /DNA_END=739 /DNA_ORIENTATION=+